jgi:C1A family cysteine protease
MPQPGESVVGGHAVVAVGYNDAKQAFIIRNSWGPHWGMKGYSPMPYPHLMDPNLSDDFWTIHLFEPDRGGKKKPAPKKKKR